jgi:hypothetical protein
MRGILLRLPPPPGRCTSAPTTIKVKACRLEQDKVCTTELKVVGDKVSYEKGECKQVEVCKPLAYFVPRTGYGKQKRATFHEQMKGYSYLLHEQKMREQFFTTKNAGFIFHTEQRRWELQYFSLTKERGTIFHEQMKGELYFLNKGREAILLEQKKGSYTS